MHIYESNRGRVEAAYTQAVGQGIADPVVILADTRDALGRQIALGFGMAGDDLEKEARRLSASGQTPVLTAAVERARAAMGLESSSPTIGTALARTPPPGGFFVVVVAFGGNTGLIHNMPATGAN
jgi:hypothetical protein